MRFRSFDLGQPTPSANTVHLFRKRLMASSTLSALFERFERQLEHARYFPRSGQIVDAMLIAALRQHTTDQEKQDRRAKDTWPDAPHKTAQKDVDARWTVRFSRAEGDGKNIVIPLFVYKSHMIGVLVLFVLLL